ncbi:EF-hand domain-containing family member B-like [Trichoplusia ni]|uniref:EF-hand domain-containing family member B-like n=1 Tax=Trichoplusia ni TaxID=7111 RepID=A0A7E5VMV7_TRINI|nr:EF-hand domain-containing family member B-like [Trichoplusia ni]
MMSKVCIPRTQGGKGNRGMFIERDPHRIIAAGKVTEQGTEKVSDHLQHYLLKDHVDALIHDAIIPEPKDLPRRQKTVDMRNAGPFTEARDLINPPIPTKFTTLVVELRNTTYNSYWNKCVGQTRDQTPLLPEGARADDRRLGIKTKGSENLYDLIMPKVKPPDNTSPKKQVGYKTDRNYCKPPYDPQQRFGVNCKADKRGIYVKCCLSDKSVLGGGTGYTRVSSLDADMKDYKHAKVGLPRMPNANIECVPPGHSFGKLEPRDGIFGCFTTCGLNAGRPFYLECLADLNTLRKFLSRRFDSNFFANFYLKLKYLDKEKSGWLPKEVVYEKCTAAFIRFKPATIEPLLELWGALDGSLIEYKKFVHIINFREPSPKLPKIIDMLPDCVDFTTTYREMIKPGQELDTRPMAGLPSGRYFDEDYPVTPDDYCKADRISLPQETDAKCCINPSALSILGITHRDMYAKRSPELVRSVYDKAGVHLTDEEFNGIWEEAKKHHSQGWVCFETFKRVYDHKYGNEV